MSKSLENPLIDNFYRLVRKQTEEIWFFHFFYSFFIDFSQFKTKITNENKKKIYLIWKFRKYINDIVNLGTNINIDTCMDT